MTTNAQAQPSYYDDRMDNNDRKSYGNDTYNYKSKYSSSYVKDSYKKIVSILTKYNISMTILMSTVIMLEMSTLVIREKDTKVLIRMVVDIMMTDMVITSKVKTLIV